MYEKCPAQFKYKTIDKLPDPGSAATQRGNDVHKAGERFLKGEIKTLPPEFIRFKDQMKALKKLEPMVEQQWGFTADWQPTGWFGSNTWLRIVCDVAIEYDDNTAEVIDFKTGKKYSTNEDQIELFSGAPFMRRPEIEHVTARLWYLDVPDGPKEPWEPHPDSTANEVIREYTRDDWEKSKPEWVKRTRAMFNDKKFAPKPNSGCQWCPYSKAKGGPCKY